MYINEYIYYTCDRAQGIELNVVVVNLTYKEIKLYTTNLAI